MEKNILNFIYMFFGIRNILLIFYKKFYNEINKLK